MSVLLTKGKKVNLSKEADNLGIRLEEVALALGWDCNETGGASFDLDAWALAVNDKGLQKKNLVYFANTYDSSMFIHHCGDNLTGAGDGDDETITIKLDRLPKNYKHVLVGVTIYHAASKHQSFKDVENTFIRIYDTKTNKEICKYGSDKFKEEFGNCISLLFGVLSRVGSEWEFNAVGKGDKFGSIPSALNVYKEYALDNADIIKQKERKKVMAVNLSKGGKVSLAKVAADAGIQSLTKLVVGLGWDVNKYDGGADFDLDASAFCCGANGKVTCDEDFVFYNNKIRPGIEHTGDNRTGEGEGDDETIKVDLSKVPDNISEINFTVTIDQADKKHQNFGMVENSYIRVVDEVSGQELIKYDLGEDFSFETAIVVAKIYKHNGEWRFNAIGSGFNDGLAGLCRNFGVNV